MTPPDRFTPEQILAERKIGIIDVIKAIDPTRDPTYILPDERVVRLIDQVTGFMRIALNSRRGRNADVEQTIAIISQRYGLSDGIRKTPKQLALEYSYSEAGIKMKIGGTMGFMRRYVEKNNNDWRRILQVQSN